MSDISAYQFDGDLMNLKDAAARAILNNVFTYHPRYNMEIGTINAGTTPPTYGTNDKRVRTMVRSPDKLKAGDRIYITGGLSCYVIWESNAWHNSGRWVTEWTVLEDGDYYFTIKQDPEVKVENIEDITSQVWITRYGIPKQEKRDWFVRSMSHRGYSRYAPENSAEAIRLASWLGWDGVEIDVRFTSDGVPVCLHNDTINSVARNADGTALSSTVYINNITYEQALTYDFGIYKGGQYAGTEILKFEDAARLCRDLSLQLYVEIKEDDETKIGQIIGIVKACGMLRHSSFISFYGTALQKVVANCAAARVGFLGDAINVSALEALQTGENEVFMDMNYNSVNFTPENIALLIEAGIPLEVYTPNSSITINGLPAYVSGVTSDYDVAGKDLYDANIGRIL